MSATEHVAGPAVGGVQKCRLCGYVIDDFSNVAYPKDGGPPGHWPEGTKVVVEGTNPRLTMAATSFEGIPGSCTPN